MKYLVFCLSVLFLVVFLSFAFGEEWEVVTRTDWSHGWWCGGIIPESDTSAFAMDERIDFWSTPGELSLSSWVGITLGDGVEWGWPWGYWAGTIYVFLELPDGTLLAGGSGYPTISRSTDGGNTWLKTIGMPAGYTRNMIRIYDGSTIADVHTPDDRCYVYRSTDDGMSWTLDWDVPRTLGVDYGVGSIIQFVDSTVITTLRRYYVGVGVVAERRKETGEWEVRTTGDIALLSPYLYLENEDVLYIRGGIKKTEDHWQDAFFRSTDRGYTWEVVREGWAPWFSLIQGQDGAFYATTFGPYILKSTDRGESWDTLANLQDSLASAGNRSTVYCLLQTKDGTFYAGVLDTYGCSPQPYRVKCSTDGGCTWQDDLIYHSCWAAWWPIELFEDSEGNVFLGTMFHWEISYGIGCQIWKKSSSLTYNPFGHLVGCISFDEGREWGKINWICEENGGKIRVKLRSRIPSDGSHVEIALGWYDYVENGQDISELEHVFDGDQMINYLIEFTASESGDRTPVFYELKIEHKTYTGIQEEEPFLSRATRLAVAPNPFNSHSPCTIRYQLSESTHINLKIYDLSGRLVRILANEEQEAGYHEILWDAKDETGNRISAGIYFLRFYAAGDIGRTKKLLALK